VNADVTNFAKDIPTIYNSKAMIDEVYDVLGPYIVTAHLKDVVLEPTHSVRFAEVVPGMGILDWDTLFRRFEALLPDGYALIEHLSDYNKVMQARDFVVGKLDELDIPIRK
jgi:sugar phosphate isomerase/epimerase